MANNVERLNIPLQSGGNLILGEIFSPETSALRTSTVWKFCAGQLYKKMKSNVPTTKGGGGGGQSLLRMTSSPWLSLM
jgi:hypothetical protein